MRQSIVLCLHGLLLLQIVAAQGPKTAWQAGGAGMGLGVTSPADFNEHQINVAVVNINAATTELQAAHAAAAVFSPLMDMSDFVQQTLENKIRQLRTPANWPYPIPPPLPFNFDVMPLVMAAYYGTPTSAPPNAGAVAPAGSMPQAGVNPGPPTSIRRGRPRENTAGTSGTDALIQLLVNNQSPATREALLRALLQPQNSTTSGSNTQAGQAHSNTFGQQINPGLAQLPRPLFDTTPPNFALPATTDPFFSSNTSRWI